MSMSVDRSQTSTALDDDASDDNQTQILEQFVVTGLKSGEKVQSFPCQSISSALGGAHCQSNTAPRQEGQENANEDDADTTSVPKPADPSPIDLNITDGNQQAPERSTLEVRKAMRRQRKIEIRLKMDEKPKEDEDEPTPDVATILEAEANIGDPADDKLNAAAKVEEMNLLKMSMSGARSEFNQQLAVIRGQKCELIIKVMRHNARVRQIDIFLGADSSDMWCPAECQNVDVEKMARDDPDGLTGISSVQSNQAHPRSNDSPSNNENDELKESKEMLLLHEKTSILQELEADVSSFDASLHNLQKERLRLSVELKAGDAQLITNAQELEILREVERKGDMLSDKLNACERRKQETISTLGDTKLLLDSKKAKLDSWMEKEDAIEEEFRALVPMEHVRYDPLREMYMRDEESDGSSDNDDSQEVQNVIHLREQRWKQEKTLEKFRHELESLKNVHNEYLAKEHQSEEELVAVKYQIQQFQLERRSALNKIPAAVPLSSSQTHISEGTEERNARTPKSLPAAGVVLISNDELTKLRRRAVELKREIHEDKARYKHLQREKHGLDKENVKRENSIKQQHERCKELQMLKFGSLVDMDLLDADKIQMLDANSETGMKEKLAIATRANARQFAGAVARNRALKDQLFQATKKNTSSLNRVAELRDRQLQLENEIKLAPQQEQTRDGAAVTKDEADDRKRLALVAGAQAKEINALRAEIASFKTKNGHVFAPGGRCC